MRLDSAATISADLTETTNEDQKINLRSAKDDDVNSRGSEDSVFTDSGDDDDGVKKIVNQNARNRKHEVLPTSTDSTKCEFS